MTWLVTEALGALNLEHVQRLYADKAKIKAVMAGFPVNVAVDLEPDVAQRLVREIIDEVAQGFSVEVVGGEIRRITNLR
jgi:hypothetical protein